MGFFDFFAKKEKFVDKQDEFDAYQLARLIYDFGYFEETKSKMKIDHGEVMQAFIKKYFNGNESVVWWNYVNMIHAWKSGWYNCPVIKFLKTACDTDRLYHGTSEHQQSIIDYMEGDKPVSYIEELLYNKNYYSYDCPDYLIKVYAFINSDDAMYFVDKETGNSLYDDLNEIKAKIGGAEGSSGFAPRHEIDAILEKYKRPL
ncbi:MAG: hypothetical protein IJZ04_04165 [Clostridia bacterium]|nr:hypothetical protein [Clostridia bacterium]